MQNILLNIENKTALITINRGESLNALNQKTIQELSDLFTELESNKEIRSILITGSGIRAFVAGADIKEFKDFNSEEGEELARVGQESLFNKMENLSKPIISLINGFCLGGGLELALASHIRIASDTAKFGFPEVKLGLIPGYGGTQRLPKLVGKGMAMQMILSAEFIDSQKALEIGLINEVLSQKELINRGQEIANQINNNSGLAIQKAIQCINQSDTKEGFQKEMESFGSLFSTNDFKEGTSAFLEKRKARF